ncbi:MAG: hypothetical protein HY958_02290 [Bacteroidia bacterium]|nr:hypothetical protein [Bacteroidia bacterium]
MTAFKNQDITCLIHKLSAILYKPLCTFVVKFYHKATQSKQITKEHKGIYDILTRLLRSGQVFYELYRIKKAFFQKEKNFSKNI